MAEVECLSPLQKWLKHVNDELTPEGVDHLKLGLYSEFTSRHLEVRDVQEPSVLYHVLLERCLKNNKPKALKIFLHVLRGLGGALKGRLLVGEAFGFNSPYQIQDPGVLDLSRMSVNFKFFQCLLKISTNTRKIALGEQLMKRFCKERFLNKNCRELDGVPGLFISLHQAQFIASDFTHHLVEALSKYKAWMCLQHLNDYHKSVGLQTMVFVNAHPGVFSLSSSSEEAYAQEWSVDVKRHRPTKELDFITAFRDVVHANGLGKRLQPYSLSPNRAEERRGYDVIEASDADHLIPKSYGIQGSPSYGSFRESLKMPLKKGSMCAIAVFLLVVAVSTAVLASLLLGTVWIHLIRLPDPLKSPIRQASTVILGDFNSFYYDKVYVGIDEESLSNDTRDFDYSIDIYGIKGACVDIHKHGVYSYVMHVVVTERNISHFIPVYALSGSVFNYQLHGSTSNVSSKNKFVEVCLNRGSSYKDGGKLDCVKMPLFNNGLGRYEITDPGYYFFTVHPLDGMAEYSLNVSGTIKKIHVNTNELLGCGLNRSSHTCHLTLPAKENAYCLLAEFYKLPHHFMLAELDVRVEKTRASYLLGISLPPLIVFVLLVCLSGFGIVCIKCACKHRRNMQTWHTLTYSI